MPFCCYSLHLFPFIDLPNHLAEATVYKYAKEGTLLGQVLQSRALVLPQHLSYGFLQLVSIGGVWQ
jgi:hypothetical protein